MIRTVLFVHGLESGPRGKKAAALEAAGFHVVAGQMPCGRSAVLRDPLVVTLLGAALAVSVAAAFAGGVWGFALGAGSVALLQHVARPVVMRRIFRRSVDVQRALLAAHAIDAVVGSSFGGAVALELLHSGAWRGPTLLLCPAHHLVAQRAWTTAPALPVDASQITVVHGRQDETVPVEHARALVAGTSARLLEVDDDHRLTASSRAENFARWLG